MKEFVSRYIIAECSATVPMPMHNRSRVSMQTFPRGILHVACEIIGGVFFFGMLIFGMQALAALI